MIVQLDSDAWSPLTRGIRVIEPWRSEPVAHVGPLDRWVSPVSFLSQRAWRVYMHEDICGCR